jgi:transcriptional regulator of acetoin/glycerol metabolism
MTTPTTLAELIEALTALPSLDPVERARVCPALDKAATTVLAQVRAEAMAEATGPGGMSKTELGRRLRINRVTVERRIKTWKDAQ